MAPKKKGSKKQQQDDWEAELGETIDPIAQAEQQAKDDEAAKDAEEEDAAPAGGLMAALRKNKDKKKAKKGKPVEDFVEGEDPPAADGADEANGDGTATPPVDLDAKAPQEVTAADDEDVFGQPIKKAKGGKQQQAKPAADEDEDDEEETGGRVMTKKEKERAKKEREKARKKEQAAAKKKTGPVQDPKEEAAKVAAPTPDAPVAAAPEPATGGKKKKLNPALAALQKQQEERRKREEEAAREAAEEKARAEEEERLAAEEEQRQQEAKAAKKQREKEKIEQMKKEGKYKTKAQREAEARQKARLQQMLDAGMVVSGISDEPVEAEKKPKKDDRRKKNPKKIAEEKAAAEAKAKAEEEEQARQKLEDLRLADEQEKAVAAAAEAAKKNAESKKAEEEDELEDWEAEAAKLEDEGDDVKDSWDAESGDDQLVKPVVNGKSVQAGAAGKKADISDSESDSESDSDYDSDSSSEDEAATSARKEAERRKQEAAIQRKQREADARAKGSKENLRSPICCILGHVDTGKTKLLDKIRQTNVQEGEAGGITQQIGATYFPVEALQKKTAVVNHDGSFKFNVPGLLVIDTPGHESFTNLRSRGSSLCNIAILVVDIMHGLEPQTLESMKLLRGRKTPFIVALNKIDRLYGWKKIENNGFQESLAMQNKGVQNEFRDRLEKTKVAFAEQGFNSELFYENKSLAKNVSLVPTSAHTGEGIPDMIKLLVSLTQERMAGQLMYLSDLVECTVLEVKQIEGLGTTIDVILSNGVLREGDRIVLCGTDGPISTDIRALLTPAEMKELRVKSQYVHNKEVKAALGVKIAANGLDNAIAGSRLLVVGPDDDEEDVEDEVMGDLENLLSKISTTGRGVTVQASTLGSLEALLEFLRTSKIPVANISIGPVHKRDVITASTMLEKAKEYAIMLCFDVKVDKDAQQHADDVGVKIFTAEIIYHLFDDFNKHMNQLKEQRKEESKMLAVFPCVLRPISVFNKKDPIVIGVDVIDGNLRVNTPLAIVRQNPVTNLKEVINLGRVTSIEREHKQIPICKKGQPSVAVKIEGGNQPMYGRQLDDKNLDNIYSLISRKSIDCLKEFFRDEVTKDEWNLIAKHLKGLFDVN